MVAPGGGSDLCIEHPLLLSSAEFWRSAALSFVTSLLQAMPNGQRQHEAVIGAVARRFKIENQVNTAFADPEVDLKRLVDVLVSVLFKAEPQNALKYKDVFRALALLRSHDIATVGIAHAWLQGYDADEAIRKNLGFLTPPPTSPVEIVRGLMWVMKFRRSDADRGRLGGIIVLLGHAACARGAPGSWPTCCRVELFPGNYIMQQFLQLLAAASALRRDSLVLVVPDGDPRDDLRPLIASRSVDAFVLSELQPR